MEGAIQTVVKVFLKSSKGKERLGKKEFQNLVKSELSNMLTDTDSKEAINEMGRDLDADKDGRLGFEEYMKLVGYLAVSLSEQRNLAQEGPAQNASAEPAAQGAPDKEEKKPEANAEAKAAAAAEAKAEAKADGKLEAKAEGEAQPEAAKEEPAAVVEVVVKEETKVEITETVQVAETVEVAEKEEAEPESKTEEATS